MRGIWHVVAADAMRGRHGMCGRPMLGAQIATMREVIDQQPSAALAIMAALVEDPEPVQKVCEIDAQSVKRIEAETDDPDQARRLPLAVGLLAFAPAPPMNSVAID